MRTKLCQRFRAPNDRNGNPRRVWLVYVIGQDDMHPSAWAYDEGYGGKPDACRDIPQLPSVDVSADEYDHLLNLWRA